MKLIKTLIKKENEPTGELDGAVKNKTDSNAPKVIFSTSVTAFECRFSTLYAEAEDIEKGIFTFKAVLKDGSAFISNRKKTVKADVDFMTRLQEIIAKYNLATYNGTNYFVSGISDEYGAKISVLYDSGEEIYAADNQDCFLPVGAMSELIELFSVLN